MMKTCQYRPSQDLEDIDSVAAWCVNHAVLWFGMTIENALLERVNKGTKDKPKMEPRYTLAQLLDPDFRLPRPLPTPKAQPQQGNFGALLALAQQKGSGVKLWKTMA